LQLGTYAREKLRRRESDARAAAEKHWLAEFVSPAPTLELPADHARPRTWLFEGARENRLLPARLARELKRLSAQNNCTLFTTLLGAFAVVLRKLSAQSEIVIGVPIADRAVPGAEALIGHCVNFLPLRVRVDDDQTFAEHLGSVQRKFLDAHEHQEYGFGSLIQELKLSRPTDRMPLVSVTFNLERLSEELEFAGLQAELAANGHSFTKFDLSLNVTEMHGALRLDCRYNRSLFAAPTIRRWLGHCQALLEAAANGAGGRSKASPSATPPSR
jgi:non-ribosomal peptide synthetase component F